MSPSFLPNDRPDGALGYSKSLADLLLRHAASQTSNLQYVASGEFGLTIALPVIPRAVFQCVGDIFFWGRPAQMIPRDASKMTIPAVVCCVVDFRGGRPVDGLAYQARSDSLLAIYPESRMAAHPLVERPKEASLASVVRRLFKKIGRFGFAARSERIAVAMPSVIVVHTPSASTPRLVAPRNRAYGRDRHSGLLIRHDVKRPPRPGRGRRLRHIGSTIEDVGA